MLKFLARPRRPFLGCTVARTVITASLVVSATVLVPQVAPAGTNSEAISTVNGMTDPLVAAGGGHTCALLNAGAVTCWGRNFYGQLGNNTNSGTDTANPTPTLVELPTGTTATALTAGDNHTCAVLNTGDVTCWGNNSYAQLGFSGLSSENPDPSLVELPAGTTATALTAGDRHTCAVLNTGAVSCWGWNEYGQLGNSREMSLSWDPVPVELPTGTTATAVTAGYGHTCAVLNTGAAYCWGRNIYGQLGNNTNSGTDTANPTPTPVVLPTGTTATALNAGHRHTCAVLNTGAVTCWGRNDYGQLGNNTNSGQSTANPDPLPVVLPAGATATAVTAGGFHTCVVLNTGDLTCWGWNPFGQLGSSTNSGSLNANPDALPVVLPTGATATAVTAGWGHTCAVLNTGDVTCWGHNEYGQLGNDTNTDTNTANPDPLPVVLSEGVTATAVTAGSNHTCAVLDTGDVTCWGHNEYGQLGNDTSNTGGFNPIAFLVVLPDGTTPTALTAGVFHTCAVLNTGAVTCWGNNDFGQLGNSTNSGTSTANPDPLPVVLPAGATATAVTAGYRHTCALLNTGAVTCWGYNYSGQLGNSTNSATSTANPDPLPVVLPPGATATALIAGDNHTCAVLNTGAVTCWGYNYSGQLGNSTNSGGIDANPTPLSVVLPTGTTATAVTAGASHTCAVLNTGDLTCWGSNEYGQLGNSTNSGTSTANPTPLPVPWTVPGRPTTVTGLAGNSEVTVSWDAPTADGGSAITAYTVTSTPGAKTCTTTGALTCTVTGLTNGTSYWFEVTAANTAGSSTAPIVSDAVVPRTIPGLPAIVTTTASNGAATVVWVAPTSNGGSAITGYTVASDPDAETCTTTGAPTCTVAGLMNGTSYTFTVSATNAAGTSEASAASGAVTPATVPGAPTSATGVSGDSEVVVSWSAPGFDGGSPITGYSVAADPGGESCANTGALSCTVTGLMNGTSYTFSVVATNGAGASDASPASVAVTPSVGKWISSGAIALETAKRCSLGGC